MPYKVAVVFVGQPRQLNQTGWYHSWLFRDQHEIEIDVDVYFYTWEEDRELITPYINIADIAEDVRWLERDEFHDTMKSLSNYPATRSFRGGDNDWLNHHFSQFWCMYYFAQRDLSKYDAVFKTRTDCFPSREKFDICIKEAIDTVMFHDHKEIDFNPAWTVAGVHWLSGDRGRISDHNLLMSVPKVRQLATTKFLNHSLGRWDRLYRGDHNWFDIARQDMLYVEPMFQSPISKDGYAPSWPDHRKRR